VNTAVVLCDIEGTTTSLEFVHAVLFPLSRNRMQEFISDHWNEPWLQSEIAAIPAHGPDEVVRLLRSWIDTDQKHPALKLIQGKIWKSSFESGEIKSHLYADVPENFRKWHDRGIRIAIFSSGSAEAQQLLFRYSEAGDLAPYIERFFDTRVGSKREPGSYQKIADDLNVAPVQILFLSDIQQELDAAAASGMKTAQILREGVTRGTHPSYATFSDLQI